MFIRIDYYYYRLYGDIHNCGGEFILRRTLTTFPIISSTN